MFPFFFNHLIEDGKDDKKETSNSANENKKQETKSLFPLSTSLFQNKSSIFDHANKPNQSQQSPSHKSIPLSCNVMTAKTSPTISRNSTGTLSFLKNEVKPRPIPHIKPTEKVEYNNNANINRWTNTQEKSKRQIQNISNYNQGGQSNSIANKKSQKKRNDRNLNKTINILTSFNTSSHSTTVPKDVEKSENIKKNVKNLEIMQPPNPVKLSKPIEPESPVIKSEIINPIIINEEKKQPEQLNIKLNENLNQPINNKSRKNHSSKKNAIDVVALDVSSDSEKSDPDDTYYASRREREKSKLNKTTKIQTKKEKSSDYRNLNMKTRSQEKMKLDISDVQSVRFRFDKKPYHNFDDSSDDEIELEKRGNRKNELSDNEITNYEESKTTNDYSNLQSVNQIDNENSYLNSPHFYKIENKNEQKSEEPEIALESSYLNRPRIRQIYQIESKRPENFELNQQKNEDDKISLENSYLNPPQIHQLDKIEKKNTENMELNQHKNDESKNQEDIDQIENRYFMSDDNEQLNEQKDINISNNNKSIDAIENHENDTQLSSNQNEEADQKIIENEKEVDNPSINNDSNNNKTKLNISFYPSQALDKLTKEKENQKYASRSAASSNLKQAETQSNQRKFYSKFDSSKVASNVYIHSLSKYLKSDNDQTTKVDTNKQEKETKNEIKNDSKNEIVDYIDSPTSSDFSQNEKEEDKSDHRTPKNSISNPNLSNASPKHQFLYPHSLFQAQSSSLSFEEFLKKRAKISEEKAKQANHSIPTSKSVDNSLKTMHLNSINTTEKAINRLIEISKNIDSINSDDDNNNDNSKNSKNTFIPPFFKENLPKPISLNDDIDSSKYNEFERAIFSAGKKSKWQFKRSYPYEFEKNMDDEEYQPHSQTKSPKPKKKKSVSKSPKKKEIENTDKIEIEHKTNNENQTDVQNPEGENDFLIEPSQKSNLPKFKPNKKTKSTSNNSIPEKPKNIFDDDDITLSFAIDEMINSKKRQDANKSFSNVVGEQNLTNQKINVQDENQENLAAIKNQENLSNGNFKIKESPQKKISDIISPELFSDMQKVVSNINDNQQTPNLDAELKKKFEKEIMETNNLFEKSLKPLKQDDFK